MSALLERLRLRIAREGPLSLADYMAEALTHPQHGYYATRDPFGAGGDFITAPEVSQVFGELVGLCLADAWQALGAPAALTIAELGPGRGTLMADALRAMQVLPALLEAAELHLVEASPVLRKAQRDKLAPWQDRLKIIWHDNLGGLPEAPLLLVANEFFDALPLRQFQRGPEGWHERQIGLVDDDLCFVLGPAVSPHLIPAGLRDVAEDSLVEVSSAAASLADEIGRRLAANLGAALVIDYGHASHRCGATLQALRGHAAHEVLQDPGEADLTAHVDFALLGEAAIGAGAKAFGPVSQGAFLKTLGIELRAAKLGQGASPDQALALGAAIERLTAPDQMGDHFKVLGLASPELGALAGFS